MPEGAWPAQVLCSPGRREGRGLPPSVPHGLSQGGARDHPPFAGGRDRRVAAQVCEPVGRSLFCPLALGGKAYGRKRVPVAKGTKTKCKEAFKGLRVKRFKRLKPFERFKLFKPFNEHELRARSRGEAMGILDGKRAVIFGVANERSIAWAISQALHGQGAELAFTYAGEVLEKRVRPLAEGIGAKIILPCDVTKDEEIAQVFDTLRKEWGVLDILIHAIAFAAKEDLSNPFVQTGRQGFHLALDVSAYSFVVLSRHAAALMEGRKGSILTMTYIGSEKVIPNYNVMGVAKAALEASVRYLAHDLGPKGIRVNAISAGPLRTLAAAGISDFKMMLHHVAERAPLKRNIDAEEVGKTAIYLCSDWGSAVTGEVLHVDAGYNIMGM